MIAIYARMRLLENIGVVYCELNQIKIGGVQV